MKNTSYFAWLFSITVIVALCVGNAWQLSAPEEFIFYSYLTDIAGEKPNLKYLGMSFGLIVCVFVYLLGAGLLSLFTSSKGSSSPNIKNALLKTSVLSIAAIGVLIYFAA